MFLRPKVSRGIVAATIAGALGGSFASAQQVGGSQRGQTTDPQPIAVVEAPAVQALVLQSPAQSPETSEDISTQAATNEREPAPRETPPSRQTEILESELDQGDSVSQDEHERHARVADLIYELSFNMPCSAVLTAAEMERRLSAITPAVDELRTALHRISIAESRCADIRAAAARQVARLDELNAMAISSKEMSSTPLPDSLKLESGPAPLRLTRDWDGS